MKIKNIETINQIITESIKSCYDDSLQSMSNKIAGLDIDYETLLSTNGVQVSEITLAYAKQIEKNYREQLRNNHK